MKEAIKERARELEFDDCRVTTAEAPESAARLQRWLATGMQGEMGYLQRNADKRLDPQRVLPGAKSIITLAVSYAQKAENDQPSNVASHKGVIARYARYEDYHQVIGERLKTLAEFVNRLGGSNTRSLWYVDTGPMLERDLAQRSGLGFIGKHTNLISRKLGNWCFLSEILTTIELEPDSPQTNHCGSCSRCIAACPTNAITAPF